ncbi:MAG: amino acid ABC transporter permease [Actinomycetota bacterium]
MSPHGPPTFGTDLDREGQPRERRPLTATGRFLQEEGAKPAIVAVISTVAFFGIGAILVTQSPNWPRVRDQFFNPDDFAEAAPDVLRGFWLNLELFAKSMLVIPFLALIVAVMRSLRGPAFFPIRLLAVLFTDIFRGIPLILLVLLLGFGVPALQIDFLPSSAEFWGLAALALSYSAYTAEIYRSGIDAVPESQRSSARALGLTQWQAMRFAILPQAVRNVVPALMNTVVSLQKDVALVSILGIREAVREAQIYTSRTFNYTSYLVATLLFLAISIPLTRFVDWYTARDRRLRSQAQV